jgi:hypothetical protein
MDLIVVEGTWAAHMRLNITLFLILPVKHTVGALSASVYDKSP